MRWATIARPLLILGIVAALVMQSCSGGEQGRGVGEGEAAANPLGLLTPGVLVLGTEPSYPPFEMTARDGSVIGYDIDIIEGFAAEQGLELEIVESKFHALIPSLQTGKIDMIMSGMTITEERGANVDFSRPYYEVGQVVLIRKELEGEIKQASDLNDPKYRVAVHSTTTGHFAAQKHMPNAQIDQYDSSVECGQVVRAGQADAMVFDDPFVRIFAAENPERVTALLEPFTQEELGVAVKKGNAALLAAINEYLEKFEASDEAKRLQKDYFEDLTWKKLQ